MCERYLKLLTYILSSSGETLLTDTLRTINLPYRWARLQNPGTHLGSYSITELSQLVVIAAFALRVFSEFSLLKAHVPQIIADQFDCPRTPEAVFHRLVSVFVELGRDIQIGLRLRLSSADVAEYLQQRMRTRQTFLKLKEVYAAPGSTTAATHLEQFPNLHGGVHLPAVLVRYATFANVSTSLGKFSLHVPNGTQRVLIKVSLRAGEELHKTHKTAAPATSHVNTHLQLLRRSGAMRALRYVILDIDRAVDNPTEGDEESPHTRAIREVLPIIRSTCPLLMEALQPTRSRHADESSYFLRGRFKPHEVRLFQYQIDLASDGRDLRLLQQAYALAGDTRDFISNRQVAYYRTVELHGRQFERRSIGLGQHVWYQGTPGSPPQDVATVVSIFDHDNCAFMGLHLWHQVGLDHGTPILTRSVRKCLRLLPMTY